MREVNRTGPIFSAIFLDVLHNFARFITKEYFNYLDIKLNDQHKSQASHIVHIHALKYWGNDYFECMCRKFAALNCEKIKISVFQIEQDLETNVWQWKRSWKCFWCTLCLTFWETGKYQLMKILYTAYNYLRAPGSILSIYVHYLHGDLDYFPDKNINIINIIKRTGIPAPMH